MAGKARFIATPAVAKHRIFVWINPEVLCNQGTLVFVRDDDYTFGVLHSRTHELWSRGMGTQLREAESDFRYTPTTTFETFPFPEPTEAQRQAIAEAARELNEYRETWLNPINADGKPALSPDEAPAASPINYLDGNRTPFFISYGENDYADLITQAPIMADALKAVGSPVELMELAGCDHFEVSLENGKVNGVWAETFRQWMSNPPVSS